MTRANKKLKILFDVELSDSEAFFIGKIVALWGALEYEIFSQTLLSFPENETTPLPKAMNNIQFTEVLCLWRERVIETEKGKRRKKVLIQQHDEIKHLSEFRAAIVHGMWDYKRNDPIHIRTIRIKKKQIITVDFPPDSLRDFMTRLQEVNFNIRNPGGYSDHAKALAKKGSWVSRSFLAMASGDPRATELLPWSIREALREAEAKK